MDTEQLFELMHDYLNQNGMMGDFLNYCQDDCDLDKNEVEKAIEKAMY